MSERYPVSIIVTSYNQAATLRLLFASLERQTFMEFEVVIADDGSSDGTPLICQEKRRFPIRFVTQPDEGYRKSKIVNQAVRCAAADYLIFLDGDVILERHFVEDHFFLKKKGHFVAGRRVDLGPLYSKKVTENQVRTGKFDSAKLDLWISGLMKDSVAVKRALRVKNPILRKWLGYNRHLDILGSNFSVWKQDLEEVNGFNEAQESYWGEDGDLYIRLRNSGKLSIGAKSMCVQYHVFHKRRVAVAENVQRYKDLCANLEYKWASKGYRINL